MSDFESNRWATGKFFPWHSAHWRSEYGISDKQITNSKHLFQLFTETSVAALASTDGRKEQIKLTKQDVRVLLAVFLVAEDQVERAKDNVSKETYQSLVNAKSELMKIDQKKFEPWILVTQAGDPFKETLDGLNKMISLIDTFLAVPLKVPDGKYEVSLLRIGLAAFWHYYLERPVSAGETGPFVRFMKQMQPPLERVEPYSGNEISTWVRTVWSRENVREFAKLINDIAVDRATDCGIGGLYIDPVLKEVYQ